MAADQAAYGQVGGDYPHGDRLIQNGVTHKCLARMANGPVNTAASTGESGAGGASCIRPGVQAEQLVISPPPGCDGPQPRCALHLALE
ncbi:hypothetical protein GCM10023323_68180 [Streptomyces thinghirensis]|uniref:Uncharacterized protein n=1 Tax=Streptomyces thinghirensis TaxID=551547 RepID=A0ABP9TGF8_9ACTN